jgi:hypothetical protein
VAGFLIGKKGCVKYTKPALSFEQQAQRLLDRGSAAANAARYQLDQLFHHEFNRPSPGFFSSFSIV